MQSFKFVFTQVANCPGNLLSSFYFTHISPSIIVVRWLYSPEHVWFILNGQEKQQLLGTEMLEPKKRFGIFAGRVAWKMTVDQLISVFSCWIYIILSDFHSQHQDCVFMAHETELSLLYTRLVRILPNTLGFVKKIRIPTGDVEAETADWIRECFSKWTPIGLWGGSTEIWNDSFLLSF